jgi:hypothetical protein
MPNSRGRKRRSGRRSDLQRSKGPNGPPSLLTSPQHRRWRQAAKWVGTVTSGFFGIAGLIMWIAGIWGPVWPTGPEIHPNGLDLIRPLSVPFDIENKSIIFPVRIHSVSCNLLGEFSPNPNIAIYGPSHTQKIEIFD